MPVSLQTANAFVALTALLRSHSIPARLSRIGLPPSRSTASTQLMAQAKRPKGSTRLSDTGEFKRGPGRPVGNTETKERIVEVAVENFATHGYASASVRKIAGAADVTPPSVVHHFRSKQGLYLRVLEEVALSLDLWLFDMEDDSSGVDRVVALCDAYLGWLAAHPEYARIICFELLGEEGGPSEHTTPFLAPITAQAVAVLVKTVPVSVREQIDIEVWVLQLLGNALHFQPSGATAQLLTDGETPDEVAERVKTAFIKMTRRVFS